MFINDLKIELSKTVIRADIAINWIGPITILFTNAYGKEKKNEIVIMEFHLSKSNSLAITRPFHSKRPFRNNKVIAPGQGGHYWLSGAVSTAPLRGFKGQPH